MRRLVLISVSNKNNVTEFASGLVHRGWNIISTGGTYKELCDSKLFKKEHLNSIETFCGSTEFLGGRVKTLNETIHGGILARPNQLSELVERKMYPIDMVVCNLYPFEQVISNSNTTYEHAIENIDIGGVTMLRGAAKNHERVTVVSDPSEYSKILKLLDENSNEIPLFQRKYFALNAFKLTAQYDSKIAEYISEGSFRTRQYEKVTDLKYGCNPHQKMSAVWNLTGNSKKDILPIVDSNSPPIKVLNGNPSYINYLDAINSWQLVSDLHWATDRIAAASFKHTSPAGVGIAHPLSKEELLAYDINPTLELSDQSTAYIRARNGDPKSSFGDFVACSGLVDVSTAEVIKSEVCDGIVAAGYSPSAMDILKQKKNGNFIILQANDNFRNTKSEEFREMFGIALSQQPNVRTPDDRLEHCIDYSFNSEIRQNILVANLSLKYSQSNSVAIAKNGQIIGLGCGQQNRVDCVKLAGEKSRIWHYRMANTELLHLLKSQGLKRQQRINKMYDLIESQDHSLKVPADNLDNKDSIVLASDGFFPFPDNIHQAHKYNITHIVQPGGSTADDEIDKVCEQYKIKHIKTGKRLFYH
jgi:phosphoribosylaminoimidazolecarboxamide formyltransferase/IMP cyclohydrolase